MRVICMALATMLGMADVARGKDKRAASEVLAAARAQALRQHKNIFLIFGAPWCSWCQRLDAFLARPEINPILSKRFV